MTSRRSPLPPPEVASLAGLSQARTLLAPPPPPIPGRLPPRALPARPGAPELLHVKSQRKQTLSLTRVSKGKSNFIMIFLRILLGN